AADDREDMVPAVKPRRNPVPGEVGFIKHAELASLWKRNPQTMEPLLTSGRGCNQYFEPPANEMNFRDVRSAVNGR
ncbi:hypothetical protein, partial [Roseateles sp.]|uniref:hypothetical protein n=1 Tax=Roseateles sp. TaxID=1971397 RepID=UPI0032633CBF